MASTAGLVAAEAWVQGMRRSGDPANERRTTWLEVFHSRLNGQHHALPPGEKTKEAEDGLEIGRCSYYFIGRCEPAFGDSAILFEKPDGPCAVLPFDTGGLWHNHFEPMLGIMTPQEKRAFLQLYTMSGNSFLPQLENWGRASFSTFRCYAEGEPPSSPYMNRMRIDVTDADPRAWSWEGRYPHSNSEAKPMRPRKVFISRGRLAEYGMWLLASKTLTATKKSQCWQKISNIAEIVHDEASGWAANHYLIEIEPLWTNTP